MIICLCLKFVVFHFARTQRFKKDRLLGNEIEASDDGHCRAVGAAGPLRSRRLYQRTVECASASRSASVLQQCPVMANQFIDGADAGPFDQPSADLVKRATELADLCPLVPSGTNSRCTHGQPVPVATWGERTAPDQR